MVELSTSNGEFPLHLVAFDPNDVRGGCVRFRLPELYRDEWRSISRRVPWWWIGPEITPKEVTAHAMAQIGKGRQVGAVDDLQLPISEALPLVEPTVRDALDRIEKFGIPFFQKLPIAGI